MGLTLLQKTLVASTTPEPLSATSIKCSQIIIQPFRANSALVAIGDSTVTATKGIELTKPVATTQQSSLSIEGKGGNALDLSLIYITGQANDGVNILYEVY
jgi:hypothetical protein